MDFGTLLHVAKRNNENGKNSEGKYYSTKFSAPKKESKEKKLSDNIKKFLAKKEEEEREQARIAKQKRDQLIANRDEKAKNKIKKMLKVIKSANKSVLDDVDNENTSVTIQGPDQPDEDDYGYVSQEASALYQKYMDKVQATPDSNKFAPARPATRTDLCGTKDRVKAAILKEQEKVPGVRTKSKQLCSISAPMTSSSSLSSTGRRKDIYDPQAERDMEEKRQREEDHKKAKLKKPAPPPMDFHQLLKLAEKKQFEPVEVVVETKKEPERLLTKREKREIEERRMYFEEREKRKKEGGGGQQPANKMQPNGRIPKLNGVSSSQSSPTANDKSSKTSTKISTTTTSSSGKDTFKKPNGSISQSSSSQKVDSSSKSSSSVSNSKSTTNGIKPKTLQNGANISRSSSSSSISSSSKVPPSKQIPAPSKSMPSSGARTSSSALQQSQQQRQPIKSNYNGPTREFPPRDNGVRKTPSQANGKDIKTRQFPPPDVQKTRQFPPPDVQRSRQFPPSDVRGSKSSKKPMKRRIVDDDDSEYDSELDDFIDDGPEEGENYSSYIKEIFGYDKNRYRDVDDDCDAMESSFAQQMREEFVSKKIGLMEDLEDMRLEAEEKKRKAMKKKKLK